MRTILSDDGQYTLVFHDDSDEPEEMTKEEFAAAYGEDALPTVTERPSKPVDKPPILEYTGEFIALVDACGQVSYYYNMRDLIKADVKKAKIVASAYQHDLRYYNEQLNEWRAKAERSFKVLSVYAGNFGYEMPERKDFLNKLALSIDRRKAYKGYLNSALKKKEPATLSPTELEQKFQQRLQKRLNKKSKK